MRYLALALILLLAGCTTSPQDTVFNVPEDAPSTQDTFTGDGYDLHVNVVNETGVPLAGAAVVYFYGGSGSASGSGTVECGPTGCDGDLWWESDYEDEDVAAGLRTDGSGQAVADLEPNKKIHVAAGDVPGMTTELLTHVTVGSGGNSGTITIMLYPDTITHTFIVSVDNLVGRAGVMQGSSQSFDMLFSDEADRDNAYEARIYDLDLDATWTNGIEGGADFYVAVGDPAAPYWQGTDEMNVEPGAHTESLQITNSELADRRSEVGDAFYLHMMTDWVSASFSGLDVELTVEASLKGSNVRIQ